MALNPDALRKAQQEIEAAQNGGVFYCSKIKKGKWLRVLPPEEHLKGLYYFEAIKIQLGIPREGVKNSAVFLYSPKSLGKKCPGLEELEAAAESKDPAVLALLAKTKIVKEYLFDAVLYDDEDGEKPAAKNPNLVSCGIQVINGINKIALNKKYLPDITDAELGHDLEITKEGAGLETKYSVTPSPAKTVVPPNLMVKRNDPVKYVQDQIKDDAYIRAKVRHFLYGEDEPVSGNTNVAEADPEEDAPWSKKGGSTKAVENFEKEIKKQAEQPQAEGRKKRLSELDD